MSAVTFIDAEDAVYLWVKTLTLPTSPKIFLSARTLSLPSVEMARVGGGPISGSTPMDSARISFSVRAANRPQAKSIVKALMSEIESLAYSKALSFAGGLIHGGSVVSMIWLPDDLPDPPTARYVVDSLFYIGTAL